MSKHTADSQLGDVLCLTKNIVSQNIHVLCVYMCLIQQMSKRYNFSYGIAR